MASITKRESGKWKARVSWLDNFGKLHQKSKGGFNTKRDALIWSIEQESKLNLGTDIGKDISLVDYWKHCVKTYKEPKLSQISIDHHRRVFQKDFNSMISNIISNNPLCVSFDQ